MILKQQQRRWWLFWYRCSSTAIFIDWDHQCINVYIHVCVFVCAHVYVYLCVWCTWCVCDIWVLWVCVMCVSLTCVRIWVYVPDVYEECAWIRVYVWVLCVRVCWSMRAFHVILRSTSHYQNYRLCSKNFCWNIGFNDVGRNCVNYNNEVKLDNDIFKAFNSCIMQAFKTCVLNTFKLSLFGLILYMWLKPVCSYEP